VDNVVRRGRVGNPDYTDPQVEGVRTLLQYIKDDSEVEATTIATVGTKVCQIPMNIDRILIIDEGLRWFPLCTETLILNPDHEGLLVLALVPNGAVNMLSPATTTAEQEAYFTFPGGPCFIRLPNNLIELSQENVKNL
jgi:hypothetical protein